MTCCFLARSAFRRGRGSPAEFVAFYVKKFRVPEDIVLTVIRFDYTNFGNDLQILRNTHDYD